jgi:hypothetical protein
MAAGEHSCGKDGGGDLGSASPRASPDDRGGWHTVPALPAGEDGAGVSGPIPTLPAVPASVEPGVLGPNAVLPASSTPLPLS